LLQGNPLWKEVVEQDPANLNAEFLTQIVQVKIDVVNQDLKEMGLRKSLNLGHTIGHAVESAAIQSGNPLQHGHCVILGLLAELRISEIELGLDSDVLKQFSALADQHYMELKSHKVEFESLYPFLKLDKKNEQNEVRFVLLKLLGQTEVDLAVSEGVIQEGVNHLKKWQSR
jgi:3-dehydroquinate synthase